MGFSWAVWAFVLHFIFQLAAVRGDPSKKRKLLDKEVIREGTVRKGTERRVEWRQMIFFFFFSFSKRIKQRREPGFKWTAWCWVTVKSCIMCSGFFDCDVVKCCEIVCFVFFKITYSIFFNIIRRTVGQFYFIDQFVKLRKSDLICVSQSHKTHFVIMDFTVLILN